MSIVLRHPAVAPLAFLIAVVISAQLLRHGLVEPAALSARCDAAPWQGWDCRLRSLTVQLFVEQRIGFVALSAGAAALALRSQALAWLGLGSGAAGLVLYSAGPAAPGLLLGALVLVRARFASGSRR